MLESSDLPDGFANVSAHRRRENLESLTLPSGSMMKRPLVSTPLSSSYTPYILPMLPPGSESIAKGMSSPIIFDSS